MASFAGRAPLSEDAPGRFGLGPWEVDLAVGVARAPGRQVSLTATECALLQHLRASDGPVSRRDLLRDVWHYAPRARSRTVDTTLRRLRDKLEPDRRAPALLLTYRSEGIALVGVRAPRPTAATYARRPEVVRLVGRERDLEELADQLEPGRVVTLVGPPGVGKTALAVAALGLWAGAAVFVDVHDAAGAAAIDAAVQGTLDRAAESGLRDGLSRLDRPLLVLDGLDGAARLAPWREHAAILVTSQRPLGVAGERVRRVMPLDDAASRALVADTLERQDLDLEPAEIEAVVAASGGLPLAVRLTVGAAALAGPERLADLTFGGDAHNALTTALERAWSRLPEASRRALARLSAFAGSFDFAGAAAVLPEDPLATVADLHARGWLVGQRELRVLAPIRAWAASRAAASELAGARRALAAWFVALGRDDYVPERLARRYRVDQVRALEHASTDDMRLGLAWTLASGARTVGLTPDVAAVLASAEARADELRPWVAACRIVAGYARWSLVPELAARAADLPDGAPAWWVRALLAREPTERRRAVEAGVEAVSAAEVLSWAQRATLLADLHARDPDAERASRGLRALVDAVADLPELRFRVAAMLASVEAQRGAVDEARRVLTTLQRGDPLLDVLRGALELLAGEASAEQTFTRAALDLARRGDAVGEAKALTYAALARWAAGGSPEPVRPADELPAAFRALRAFLADPAGDPARLPDPEAARLVAAWQAGAPVTVEGPRWSVRVLAGALSRRPSRPGVTM